MTEKSALTPKDLLDVHKSIAQNIRTLQLAALPHMRFAMLIERAEELDIYLKTTSRNSDTTVRNFVDHIRMLLGSVHKNAVAHFSASQSVVDIRFTTELHVYKKQLRESAAALTKTIGQQEREDAATRLAPQLLDMAAKLQGIVAAIRELDIWATPKATVCCHTMGKVFGMLEGTDALATLWTDVQALMRAKAREYIADSQIFDEHYYLEQQENKGAGIPDTLTHYLASDTDASPHALFNPRYYSDRYEEVGLLRFNPLEHFVRYGEALQHNPGPEFDATYYLEANDDVLDARIPPFQHFILHGMPEGRPPSPAPGAFFARLFIHNTPVTLTFVGTPDNRTQGGWSMLQTRCEDRNTGSVRRIPAAEWTGSEPVPDAVVVGKEAASLLSETLLHRLNVAGCNLLYLGAQPEQDLAPLLRQKIFPLEKVCAVTPEYGEFLRWQESHLPLRLRYYPFEPPEHTLPFLDSLLNSLSSGRTFDLRRTDHWHTEADSSPLISVVSIIYRKSTEMIAFLEALNRQDLAREFEVVLVDDASPDDSVKRVEQWLDERRALGLINRFMTVRILRNESNLGNCSSRNRGIESARADIVLVVDGDVALSANSLSEHLWAHHFEDCDAIIGFSKFNMDFSFVFHWLAANDVNPDIVHRFIASSSEMERLYMRSLPNSIFNFVTRNTSIRKSAFHGEYFDEVFNYSSDVNSGYGEEDHEIAAKLYFNNRRIHFLQTSICVHMRHADNSYNADKAVANLRNWNRLILKHPDLKLVDRQYFQWRTQNLLQKTASKPDAPEVVTAQAYYTDPRRAKVVVPPSRSYRILSCGLNGAYEYELCKMHHQFTMTTFDAPHSPYATEWDNGHAPRPHNVTYTRLEAIDPDAYDFAIIPFDERMLVPGQAYESLKSILELTRTLPRVALCHDMPLNHAAALRDRDATSPKEKRNALDAILQGTHVVHASHEGKRRWAFADSSVLWQGFSPQEYPKGTHARQCLTFSQKDFASEADKGPREILLGITEKLAEGCMVECMEPPMPHPDYKAGTREWGVAKHEWRTDYVGSFLMQITPFRTPAMPRLRSEAMLTGVIPVTLQNADTDKFIRNGVNGFSGDSAEELAEYMCWLLRNEKQREEISRNARLTAMDIFNIDRFVSRWTRLLLKLL